MRPISLLFTSVALVFFTACAGAQVSRNENDIAVLRKESDSQGSALRKIETAAAENQKLLGVAKKTLEGIDLKLTGLEAAIDGQDKEFTEYRDAQEGRLTAMADGTKEAFEAAEGERVEMNNLLLEFGAGAGSIGTVEKITNLEETNTKLDQRLGALEKNEAERGLPAPLEHIHKDVMVQLQQLEDRPVATPSGDSSRKIDRLPGGIPATTGALLGLLAFLMLIPVVLLVVNIRSSLTRRFERHEREMEDLSTAQRMATRLAQQATKPQKDFEEEEAMHGSIESFKILLEEDDNRLNHLFNIGTSFEDLGAFRIATEWFDSCTKLKPDYTNAWIEKGVCLAMTGNYKQADIALEKALKQNPDHPRAWYNKACILAKLGNDDEMFRAVSESVRLDPDARARFQDDPDFQRYQENPEFMRRLG